jgi:hypothetical protein
MDSELCERTGHTLAISDIRHGCLLTRHSRHSQSQACRINHLVTGDSTDNFNHLRAETPRPELLVLSSIASETGVGTAFSNVEMR